MILFFLLFCFGLEASSLQELLTCRQQGIIRTKEAYTTWPVILIRLRLNGSQQKQLCLRGDIC